MDFSLTTLFVSPVGNTLPSSGFTQALTPGQFGIFRSDYQFANAGNIAASPYFYVAQGRANTYLQSSKRSDKISGRLQTTSKNVNVVDYRKVVACPTPITQITAVGGWNVKCGETVTLTLRAHSSYIDTLYFNGFTRSVTVQAPCCDCGDDPCDIVDQAALIDSIIAKLQQAAPSLAPENVSFNSFFTFSRNGTGTGARLIIAGKPLTSYGQPCDVAAFPAEYDRMWFSTYVYSGPATTADFIVADNCDIVATATVLQESSYAYGTSGEIAQLEKNFYSYQAGYLKHLVREAGYNANFESYVTPGTVYDQFIIKFIEYDRDANSWQDAVPIDQTVIIAVPQAQTSAVEAILAAALGAVVADNACATTTTTTTV